MAPALVDAHVVGRDEVLDAPPLNQSNRSRRKSSQGPGSTSDSDPAVLLRAHILGLTATLMEVPDLGVVETSVVSGKRLHGQMTAAHVAKHFPQDPDLWGAAVKQALGHAQNSTEDVDDGAEAADHAAPFLTTEELQTCVGKFSGDLVQTGGRKLLHSIFGDKAPPGTAGREVDLPFEFAALASVAPGAGIHGDGHATRKWVKAREPANVAGAPTSVAAAMVESSTKTADAMIAVQRMKGTVATQVAAMAGGRAARPLSNMPMTSRGVAAWSGQGELFPFDHDGVLEEIRNHGGGLPQLFTKLAADCMDEDDHVDLGTLGAGIKIEVTAASAWLGLVAALEPLIVNASTACGVWRAALGPNPCPLPPPTHTGVQEDVEKGGQQVADSQESEPGRQMSPGQHGGARRR